jgi:hypothetical protein
MAKLNEQQQLLEQIRRLLILGLSQQGVEGKRMAEVIGVDPASLSRVLSAKKAKK